MEVVLAASAVVTDADGRVLLVRRGREPQRGRWSVPGGRVEPGETLEEAAAREVHEETGLRVEVDRELWSVRVPIGDGREFEIHDFAATVAGGELAHGDDATDARWVAPSELPELRLTIHLIDHLRRARIAAPLPHVDEHAVTVAAGREAVWSALGQVVEGAGTPWFAGLLGCDDTVASGPRPLAVGSTVPGFHVVAADRPAGLRLAGRHRFSDYELVFRIDELGRGRSRLRAETRALFPGRLGAVYRMLLLGAGLHARATRGILSTARRAAEMRATGSGGRA
ncbi:NUDIX hydrolase [Agromyces sp. ZXT2-6]|uniref:NUDIX hydrolase n=1 Tax=Agromyces sp. ZXT2-6 TaxID=3461153 RepID=UPI004054C53E